MGDTNVVDISLEKCQTNAEIVGNIIIFHWVFKKFYCMIWFWYLYGRIEEKNMEKVSPQYEIWKK